MQGKMKSFFEDTGIILVLSGTIYGGYYLYTTFVGDSEKKNEVIENKIVIKDTIKIQKDNNTSISLKINEKNLINNDQNRTLNSVVKTPVITPILVEKKENKKKIIKKPELIEKVEIQENLVKKEEPIVEKVITKKEIKKIDKTALQKFIQNIETKMSQNIRVNNNIDEETSINLKIRVTILKDGSYEQLIFTGGDKNIYNKNRKNLLKIFPLTIEDSYINAFPRYLRLTLK